MTRVRERVIPAKLKPMSIPEKPWREGRKHCQISIHTEKATTQRVRGIILSAGNPQFATKFNIM